MKKLLQLNVTANWGSTGKIAEGIGLAAQRRGWESYIAYGRYMNPSESRLIRVGKRFDVYSHYALNRALDGEGTGSKRATRRLITRIGEISPDIIHLHNIHDHWLNYPVLFEYLRSVDTPVVWTFHDCWAFTGGCGHFEEWNCEKWQNKCGLCPGKRNLIDRSRRNHERKIELFASLGDRLTIVSVSRWLDSLVGASRLGHLSHTYIYNGLDTDVFRPRDTSPIDEKYGLAGKHVLLGVASVWTEFKGLNDYIALSRMLPDDYVIALVGLDASRLKNVPHKILAIPRTDNADELSGFYSRADAVLSLSKAETFGLTLAEGLACGTPAIGYASTAVREIITSETGIAVSPGNLDMVKDAIMSLCSGETVFDPDVCRAKAIGNFNRDTQYARYIDLYDTILSQRNK